ncbi:MAG: Penicillin-binding protein 4* [Fimbriimonadaceae bacterium]|nr:Penicillin-binding protein 4* [Fimbriimonadaceae bacterium]
MHLLALAAIVALPPASIDDAVRAEMRERKVPGIAVAVLKNGKPIHIKGYGYATLEHQVPVTRKTIFQLGSVGKQFTAALITLLARDGKLSLDDPLSKHFPEAGDKWSQPTIRDLLCHQSGLPDLNYHAMNMRQDYSEAELAKMMVDQDIPEAPRTKFRYNNGGYVMLGVIASRVGGKFYGDQLTERVLRPAGMKTARIINEAAIIPHRSAGYQPGPNNSVVNQDWVAPKLNTTADGSMYASLDDMIAWEQTLRKQSILTKAEWERCWTSNKTTDGKDTGYGFGWMLRAVGNDRLIEHSGGWQGFAAYIGRFEKDGTTVIVLSNFAMTRVSQLGHQILTMQAPKLPLSAAKPPEKTD